jgi:hypothetical protein
MTEFSSIVSAQEIVHSDDDVSVVLRKGTGDTLVILFPSVAPDRLDHAVIPERAIARYGGGGAYHVLAIYDPKWDWFSRAGVKAKIGNLIDGVRDRLSPRKIVATGGSGGGTMALDLCRYQSVDAVLALNPQIDMGDAMTAFDRRGKKWRGFLHSDGELPDVSAAFSSDVDVVIFHGLRGPDAAHAALCPLGNRVQHYLFPDLAHSLGARLSQDAELENILAALTQGDLNEIDVIARKSGAIPRGDLGVRSPSDSPWNSYKPNKSPKQSRP